MQLGSETYYSNKENHLPARVIHIHHSCNCTKQTVSCVGVAFLSSGGRGRRGIDAASRVTRQPEVVTMVTPTKKHSQQRNGINSLADNVRRCFKWRNKRVHFGTSNVLTAGPYSTHTHFVPCAAAFIHILPFPIFPLKLSLLSSCTVRGRLHLSSSLNICAFLQFYSLWIMDELAEIDLSSLMPMTYIGTWLKSEK